MNCPKCGAPIETDSKFCVSCGASLETVQTQEEPAVAKAEATVSTSPMESVPEKKISFSTKKLIGLAVGTILIVAAGQHHFRYHPDCSGNPTHHIRRNQHFVHFLRW